VLVFRFVESIPVIQDVTIVGNIIVAHGMSLGKYPCKELRMLLGFYWRIFGRAAHKLIGCSLRNRSVLN
jgi:hypothetical protein